MPRTEILLPIKGVHKGLSPEQQPAATSDDMNNVRPRDVLENRIRIGQRPGLKKAYTQRIGGAAIPVVWLGEIITVT